MEQKALFLTGTPYARVVLDVIFTFISSGMFLAVSRVYRQCYYTAQRGVKLTVLSCALVAHVKDDTSVHIVHSHCFRTSIQYKIKGENVPFITHKYRKTGKKPILSFSWIHEIWVTFFPSCENEDFPGWLRNGIKKWAPIFAPVRVGLSDWPWWIQILAKNPISHKHDWWLHVSWRIGPDFCTLRQESMIQTTVEGLFLPAVTFSDLGGANF